MNLIDFSKEGHHKIYQNTLLKIKETKLFIFSEEMSIKKKKLKFFKLIFSILNFNKENDTHFLTLDYIYKYPLLRKLNKKRKVIGTLHKEPDSFLKKCLLKNFSKKIDMIIVHSEFIKSNLNMMGIKNVEIIDYPSFYDYSNLEKKMVRKNKNIEDQIVISCLGGTRIDKGLDILLEAFKYLKKELKEKIVLNIAGKEEDIKINFIEEKIIKYNIKSMRNYKFISDEEFKEQILITDIMILPYRKIFGGNSGPMTEAIVNKIPLITPKNLNIGIMTEKYNLGLTFECENPIDLANKIEEILFNKYNFFSNGYNERLSIENFIKKHTNIYFENKKGNI